MDMFMSVAVNRRGAPPVSVTLELYASDGSLRWPGRPRDHFWGWRRSVLTDKSIIVSRIAESSPTSAEDAQVECGDE